ncbi:MAG TPA: hypothetical protein VHJ38_07735 [Nitrososphaeraceae archaeon]|jgi:uncharacterized paraquat-inducible protein A|nr:hypothetical protein [Nitrososphaeraceae archaeon]
MIKDINLHRIKWLCIFISIGSVTAFTLPYPISVLLGIGGILILNGIKNRLKLPITDKVIRSNSITSFLFYNPTQCHQSIIYVCNNCNIVHMKSECPRCKSKTKRIL